MPQRPPLRRSLRELALDTLSAHAELIPTDAVDALDEATAADVVRWIMAKQKLTTSIAQRFMASRHVELSRALGELDLVAGVSTYGDGFCPRLSRGPVAWQRGWERMSGGQASSSWDGGGDHRREWRCLWRLNCPVSYNCFVSQARASVARH